MNLRPPPQHTNDEMDIWSEELYTFLQYPFFPAGILFQTTDRYAVVGAAALTKGAAPPDSAVKGTFPVYLFASNLTENAYYSFHVPKDRKEGTNVKIAIYWYPTTDAAGGVAWEFDWESVAKDELLGAGSTHVDIHDVTDETADKVHETSYGIIAGASVANDDTIGIQILRDHDDDDDTYGADAGLIHIEIEYYIDKIGEG